MTKEFVVRIGPAMCLPQILTQFGVDPSEAFAAAGIDPALFTNADNRIAITRLGEFASRVSRLIGRPELGLLIAKSYGPHSLGLVLQLAKEGPDVRTALLNITRLLKHHNEMAFLSLTETRDEAILKYELRESGFEGVDIVFVTAIGNALRVMREFCGKTWTPAEVRFSMARPSDAAPYEAFFGAPVRFESSVDALIFPSRWLDHPVTPAPIDGAMMALPPATWDFADHVRHQIAMRIGLAPVSAPVVASAMGLSRRALDRRLCNAGVTFTQLVDEVRFARARRLLSAGQAPVSDIALALGYAEPSGFSRAFRAWAGMSPQAWRESQASARGKK